MERRQNIIPDSYNYLFTGEDDKLFAEELIRFVIFDIRPEVSPALWQDAEIYMRYKKRDVWSLDGEQMLNAVAAIWIYRLKYITEYLKKPEILAVLNELFTQERGGKNNKTLFELFEKKFHAPVDSLFLVQEKNIITKDKIGDFDKLFAYPSWIEFDDEANDVIFEKISKGELSDEQIDYFLGASDDMRHYDKWFNVAKQILTTTKNAHTFWVAGDILSIVQKAVPEDEKSQKWFKDQIFEIFWPRVGNVWPMLNQDRIDFEVDEEARILRDSIGWLESLDDLRERLPELGKDYELNILENPEEEFVRVEEYLAKKMKSGEASVSEILDGFFELAELACSEQCVERLKKIAENDLLPAVADSGEDVNGKKLVSLIAGAVEHAERYVAQLEKEGKNISKLL